MAMKVILRWLLFSTVGFKYATEQEIGLVLDRAIRRISLKT